MSSKTTVRGVNAPRVRPTFAAAFWLASVIAIPVGAIGFALDLLLR